MGMVTSLPEPEVAALCKAASVDKKTAPQMVMFMTRGPKTSGKARLNIYHIKPGPAAGPAETPDSVAQFVLRLLELDPKRTKFEHLSQFSATARFATVQFPWVVPDAAKLFHELVQQRLGQGGKVTSVTALCNEHGSYNGLMTILAEFADPTLPMNMKFHLKGWGITLRWKLAGQGSLPQNARSFWALSKLFSKQAAKAEAKPKLQEKVADAEDPASSAAGAAPVAAAEQAAGAAPAAAAEQAPPSASASAPAPAESESTPASPPAAAPSTPSGPPAAEGSASPVLAPPSQVEEQSASSSAEAPEAGAPTPMEGVQSTNPPTPAPEASPSALRPPAQSSTPQGKGSGKKRRDREEVAKENNVVLIQQADGRLQLGRPVKAACPAEQAELPFEFPPSPEILLGALKKPAGMEKPAESIRATEMMLEDSQRAACPSQVESVEDPDEESSSEKETLQQQRMRLRCPAPTTGKPCNHKQGFQQ